MAQCLITKYAASYVLDIKELCQNAGKPDEFRSQKIASVALRTAAIAAALMSSAVFIAGFACIASLSVGGFIAGIILLGLTPVILVIAHEMFVVGHNFSSVIKEQEIIKLSKPENFFAQMGARVKQAGGVTSLVKEKFNKAVKNENPYVINTLIIRHFVPKSRY